MVTFSRQMYVVDGLKKNKIPYQYLACYGIS